MAKWFIFDESNVAGPFSTEELNHKLQYGMISEQVLVWGKAQQEWKPATWWVENLDQLTTKLENQFDERLWHYAYEGEAYGPVDRKSLVYELKKVAGDANKCLIWTKGMENWAAIHEFHDLMDEIGVNRRTHPRAPLQGRILIHLDNGQTMLGQLNSISEGGFGGSNLPGLRPGEQVKVEIQSDHLAPINSQAQVRYVEEANGVVGFKFMNVSRESLSQIIGFVKNSVESEIKKFKIAS